jgi:SAM-dependent methyltransferase
MALTIDEGTAMRPAAGYDAELRRHHEVLRRAAGVQPHEHVLDLGCGSGLTTREAARAARSGSALGVDVSAPAIERARELARSEGLDNVTFEQADAQAHPFAPEHFDLALSRYGTMFFGDPGAAFTNVARALRPGGRLAMLVWQDSAANEWSAVIRRTLGPVEGGPNPFTLADPGTVREILAAAGFTGVTLTDVREPVYYGPDVPAALAWIRSFSCTGAALQRLGPAAAAQAEENLRAALAEHERDDGIWFDSRSWLVTGRA